MLKLNDDKTEFIILGTDAITVATTEADEAIDSSVFVQIMGIPPQKAASRGHFDHLWSLRLV